MSSGRSTRRALLLSLVVVGLVVGACSDGQSEDTQPPTETTEAPTETTEAPTETTEAPAETTGGEMTVVAGAGSYMAALNAAHLEPFRTQTGASIQRVEGGDDPYAQIRAQVESGNVLWDLVGCAPTGTLSNPDIFEPVDTSIVTATDDLLYDGVVGEYHVGNDVEVFPVMAYRTDQWDAEPASWADFFDTAAFPGPRGLSDVGLDSAWGNPAIALLADGVDPADLIPLDLDRAYEKLDELAPDIRTFWRTFGGSQDIIRSGEVVMNVMTDGRALQLANSGEPVAVQFNQGLRFTASFCVPKDAPNKETAFRFLNFLLENAEGQAVFTSLTNYGPVTNSGSAAAADLPGLSDFSSLHADVLIADSTELLTYVEENSDELLQRWNEWVLEVGR